MIAIGHQDRHWQGTLKPSPLLQKMCMPGNILECIPDFLECIPDFLDLNSAQALGRVNRQWTHLIYFKKTMLHSQTNPLTWEKIQFLDNLKKIFLNLEPISHFAFHASRFSNEEQWGEIHPHMSGLKTLKIYSNNTPDNVPIDVVDLSPLSNLTGLQDLDLRGKFKITHLSLLRHLTGLQSLTIGDDWGRPAFKLSRLRRFTRLQCLSISSINIRDLSLLSGLIGLKCLRISCEVTDLSPLSNLTGLKELDLRGCDVLTELSPLSTLTGLEELNFEGCEQLTELTPLMPLIALKKLNLNDCQEITDPSPLSNLTGLEELDLEACYHIRDPSLSISGLTGLRKLVVEWPGEDISLLSGLTALQHLVLYCGDVTALSPLSSLSSLQVLHFIQCQVTDLSPLSGLTDLKKLNFKDCLHEYLDLSPLSNLTDLKELAFEDCGYDIDRSSLSNLTSLKVLANGLQITFSSESQSKNPPYQELDSDNSTSRAAKRSRI